MVRTAAIPQQDQRRSSQVLQGYKRTDSGLIPADWLEATIGELIEFEGGSQPDKSVFRPNWKPGYIRLVQIRDYKTDKYETYVPVALARRFCTEDDIMIGRYGPPIFQILRGISGAYNVALIKAKPNNSVHRTLAYYFLTQDKLFRFVEKLSQRSSGQTGVDLVELRKFPFPVPPTLNEQEAIAEALSDADTLIESLEALIAKKRAIKKGAMQDLLTGRTRLPGFSGEWASEQFGRLATIRNQKVNTRGNAGARFCVELENVSSNSGQLLDFSDATDRNSSKYAFQKVTFFSVDYVHISENFGKLVVMEFAQPKFGLSYQQVRV